MTQAMYGAEGRVGNIVYYRQNGKTVARENVTPKNPQTDLQTIQRVIVAQVGRSYSKFKTLCDHSFEGITMGAKSANTFRKLNTRYLREKAAYIQQTGNSIAQFYNFQPVGSTKFVPGALIISQGQLPKMPVTIAQLQSGMYVGFLALQANTYQAFIDQYELQRGDQLTFVTVEKVNDEYDVKLARVILDPRNPDGSGAAMSTALITESAITSPNWRNKGNFNGALAFDSGIQFKLAEGGTLVAAGVIVSRKDGKEWLRSNCQLVISEENLGSDKCSLYAAVEQSYTGSNLDIESEYYLNNAGEGGVQGSDDGGSVSPVEPGTPTFSNSATINGVQQSIAGGSVTVTAPVNTVVVTGTNLTSNLVYAVKSGSSEHIAPTSSTATSLTFSGLAVAAGASVAFFKAGGSGIDTQWFAINAQAAGGDDDGDGGD